MATRLVSKTAPNYPTNLPVTVADFKTHARVTASAEDTLIQQYLIAATNRIERKLQRSLTAQQWSLYMDAFPYDFPSEIHLPKPPIATVDQLTYKDVNNVTQTLTLGTDFQVDILTVGCRIRPMYQKIWPVVRYATYNTVQIDYSAGWTSGNMPEEVRMAIRYYASILYQNREPTKADMTVLNDIIAPLKLWGF